MTDRCTCSLAGQTVDPGPLHDWYCEAHEHDADAPECREHLTDDPS